MQTCGAGVGDGLSRLALDGRVKDSVWDIPNGNGGCSGGEGSSSRLPAGGQQPTYL